MILSGSLWLKSPEEKRQAVRKCAKIVVSINGRAGT